MTTAVMHTPVAHSTGTLVTATTNGDAFPSTGNTHGSATQENQVADHHEAWQPKLSL